MAGDNMTAQLIAQLHGPFQINPYALDPVTKVGTGQGFCRGLNREPVRALVHHRQADTGTGNGRANVNGIRVKGRVQSDSGITALAQVFYLTNVCDYSGKHVRSYTPARCHFLHFPHEPKRIFLFSAPSQYPYPPRLQGRPDQ